MYFAPKLISVRFLQSHFMKMRLSLSDPMRGLLGLYKCTMALYNVAIWSLGRSG